MAGVLTLGPGDPRSYQNAGMAVGGEQANAPTQQQPTQPTQPQYSQDEQNALDVLNSFGLDPAYVAEVAPGFLNGSADWSDTDSMFSYLQDTQFVQGFRNNFDKLTTLGQDFSSAQSIDDIKAITEDAPLRDDMFGFGQPNDSKLGLGQATTAATNLDIPLVKQGNGERLVVTDLGYGFTQEYIDDLTRRGQLPELPDGFEWETHRKTENGDFIISPREPNKGQNLASKVFPALVTTGITMGTGMGLGSALASSGIGGFAGGAISGTGASAVNQAITTGDLDPSKLLTDAVLSGTVSSITANLQTSGEVLTGIDPIDEALKEANVIGIDSATGEYGWLTDTFNTGADVIDTALFGSDKYYGMLNNPVVNPILDAAGDAGLDSLINWVAEAYQNVDDPSKVATYDKDTHLSQGTAPSADVVLANPEEDIAQIQEDNPDVIVVPGLPPRETTGGSGDGSGDSEGSGTDNQQVVTENDDEEPEQILTGGDPFGDTTAPEPDQVVTPDNEVPEPDQVLTPDPTQTVPEPDNVVNPDDPDPDQTRGGGATEYNDKADFGWGGGDDGYELFDYFRLNEPKAAVLRKRASALAKAIARMEITG